jgi:hypothetical protein
MKKSIGCLNILVLEDLESGWKMLETGISQEIDIGPVLSQCGNQKIEMF